MLAERSTNGTPKKPFTPRGRRVQRLQQSPTRAGPSVQASKVTTTATRKASSPHRRSTTQPEKRQAPNPIPAASAISSQQPASSSSLPTLGTTTRKHHLGEFDSVWQCIEQQRQEKVNSHPTSSLPSPKSAGRFVSGPVTRIANQTNSDSHRRSTAKVENVHQTELNLLSRGVSSQTPSSTPSVQKVTAPVQRSNYGPLPPELDDLMAPNSSPRSSSCSFPSLPSIPFTKSQWVSQRERKDLRSLLLDTGGSHDQFGAHIFVDHSNIYYGAYRLLGKTRFCYPRLYNLVEDMAAKSLDGDRIPVIKRVMAASNPVPEECVSAGREYGYDVYVLERQRKEMFVDELLHMKISESLLDYGKGVLCLVTGDGNRSEFVTGFGHHVARALARDWKVKVISWSSSLSTVYRRSFPNHPNLEVILLDDFVNEIIAIPRRRSLSQEFRHFELYPKMPQVQNRTKLFAYVKSNAGDLAITTRIRSKSTVVSKTGGRTPRGTKLRHLQTRGQCQTVQ